MRGPRPRDLRIAPCIQSIRKHFSYMGDSAPICRSEDPVAFRVARPSQGWLAANQNVGEERMPAAMRLGLEPLRTCTTLFRARCVASDGEGDVSKTANETRKPGVQDRRSRAALRRP
jgi:hypothetical protein